MPGRCIVKAAELIGQAVSFMPDDARAHNNLGTAYQALKRIEEALRISM